ncbi:glutaminase A [Selenihalanaerobacter shriftii]|uniref:glutaminase A n=1 Tax=Selenihalanaerobacter shriftii TaxID=142842 RepID=UPI000999C4D8
MQRLLEKDLEKYSHYHQYGKVPTYIPALAKADPTDVGISIINTKGNSFCIGECQKKFSLQSVSKPLALILAIMDNGKEKVFSKVGMEPTGDPFNSINKLTGADKPYNPMINAGAIAVTSMIKGKNSLKKFQRIIDLFKKLSGNENLDINHEVYSSEIETGNRNRSLAYYMKDKDIIEGQVEDIVKLYFKQCSIAVTCTDIANMASVLANEGVIPKTSERVIPRNIAQMVRTLMATCGMYDESGRFALTVGLPAKSGVGGGIMAVVPNRFGIGTYGPALDEKGNSIVGMKILEELSKKLDLSIY